ncbi:MAG: nicotinate-nucleotide adenylyltransferase [Chloroflexi bacterium]|nr:nicotinate-nucleotide adenylyltransferase [Chloroflexota bacterium]MCL5612060.1 nicotinate-nucleotide adenylyltransferase [Chloroflexota bacterium]
MNERIGIFGGTFDPPHLGHLILAAEARAQLNLTRLLWVLTPTPPHKLQQPISPIEDRLTMLKLALKDEPAFELSTMEMERPGPHYTLDTLQVLADKYPGVDLILLLGGDSLRDLPTWYRPADLVAACRQIGVMRRPSNSVELSALEKQIPGITDKVRFVDAPLLEIASHEIRRRASSGLPFRYYLLPSVYDYVIEHKLYQKS